MSAESTPLQFYFPSRSGGADHQIVVDDSTLRVRSCSCPAWQHGRPCHAVLALEAGEILEDLACMRWQRARGLVGTRFAHAVAVLNDVRRRRALATRELASREHRSEKPIPYHVTELGRQALAVAQGAVA